MRLAFLPFGRDLPGTQLEEVEQAWNCIGFMNVHDAREWVGLWMCASVYVETVVGDLDAGISQWTQFTIEDCLQARMLPVPVAALRRFAEIFLWSNGYGPRDFALLDEVVARCALPPGRLAAASRQSTPAPHWPVHLERAFRAAWSEAVPPFPEDYAFVDSDPEGELRWILSGRRWDEGPRRAFPPDHAALTFLPEEVDGYYLATLLRAFLDPSFLELGVENTFTTLWKIADEPTRNMWSLDARKVAAITLFLAELRAQEIRLGVEDWFDLEATYANWADWLMRLLAENSDPETLNEANGVR